MRFSVTVDQEINDWLEADIKKGRFGSKSQAAAAHLRQMFQLERENKDVVRFLIETMELVAARPSVVEDLKKVWEVD